MTPQEYAATLGMNSSQLYMYSNGTAASQYAYQRSCTMRLGIPYPNSQDEARRLVDELDSALYMARMSQSYAPPVERVIYKDSKPATIPTNKKLLLITK